MPRVSVIIPCYNHGAYLDEAVNSVLSQSFRDLEIIIVNDGSTDGMTNRLLAAYHRDRTSVLTTANQGLAAARNHGIAAAAGEFILPLDADDRIDPDYIRQAVARLEADPAVGIVYCRARLFGAVETDWQLPDYDLEEMLRDNIIFCSALFRRADWELVGGYDPGMIYGWEDYDFWLALIERGRRVEQLPGRYFHYRVDADSMVRSKEKWQKIAMFKRIFERHRNFFGRHIEVWLRELVDLRETYRICRLYVDCGQGLSDRDSVARKVSAGPQRCRFDIGPFANKTALRFDPIDCPACLSIDHIELQGRDGVHDVSPASLGSNALSREGSLFRFADSDPQLTIPASPQLLSGVHTVVVQFTIVSIAEQALQDIIAAQQKRCSDGWRRRAGALVDAVRAKLSVTR